MKLLRAFPAFALLVLVGVWFSGCTTTYQKAGVHVTLTAATVNADNSVTLALQLQNENLMAVAVTRTEFKVSFDGVNYGQAVGTKPVALAELGTSQHVAVLKLGDAAAAARLNSALAAGPVAYVLDCRLRCDVGDEELILTAVARGQVGGR
jgi:LEA14-like dessication related protein